MQFCPTIQGVKTSVDTTQIHYKLPTYQFVHQTTSPILLIHGDADQAIYLGSSLKLKAYLKPTDQLVILKGEGHTELGKNKAYLKAFRSFSTVRCRLAVKQCLTIL